MVHILIEVIDNTPETHKELTKYLLDNFNLILDENESGVIYKILKINDEKRLIYTEEDDKLIEELSKHHLVKNVKKNMIIAELC